jgi:polar amino acid transport system substrate-binding protein
MRKILSIAALSLIGTIALAAPVWAETVIEKVARTGVLTVGTRIDTVPYAYVNDRQELVGYSIDVLNLIKQQLEEQLGKEITLQIVVEEEFTDRIPQIVNREVDISCQTAFTWERDRLVDFSLSYSISGIRLLVPRDSKLDGSPDSLIGKRIGIAPNNVAEATMKLVQPQATLVPVQDVEDGFKSLDEGKIDALAGDTVILAGTALKRNPDNYRLTPTEDPYARYGIACMVPENDSSFLDLVNYSIVKLMQGYLTGEKRSVEMVNRSFGPEGLVPLPPELIRDFFQTIIITREQIPLSPNRSASNAEIKSK